MAGKGGGNRGAGRRIGSRNRSTIERERIAAEIAERTMLGAKATGKRLAKEMLDDFMQLFAGLAAHYQPLPPGVVDPTHVTDEARFEKYARLTLKAATALAPFQSPTFAAVQHQFAPPVVALSPPVPGDAAKVIELRDPKTIHRTYLALVKGG